MFSRSAITALFCMYLAALAVALPAETNNAVQARDEAIPPVKSDRICLPGECTY
ncbi:hypothetical protein GY45DRAFT_1331352 [Cubamyces sp. BRFM 1775]|nr:hypothetical protein GY45DRAFT_1331352 [Cubamyces sp. BRFM 1775]